MTESYFNGTNVFDEAEVLADMTDEKLNAIVYEKRGGGERTVR